MAPKPSVGSGAAEAVRSAESRPALTASRHVLKMASDERLVARVRAGNDAGFTVLYERYQRQILSFCRHMLGSADQAEDAVQQTFINAYRDLLRDGRQLYFRPWLYRIARNHCISLLRRRREEFELGAEEPSLVGLSEQVAGRAELRHLLDDVAQLPVDQREALILSELQDHSHEDVAEILGCDREKVKSLVFQARTSLISSREARDVSCDEIRRQLSVLRGGALRRNLLRRHLKTCDGCRVFGEEVKRQRQAMALILPVVPSSMLKFGAANALAAAKAGTVATAGGSAAGGGITAATATGSSSGVLSGSLSAFAGKLGVPVLTVKSIAAAGAVAVLAGGGTVAATEVEHALKDSHGSASQGAGRDARGGASSAAGNRAESGDASGAGSTVIPSDGNAHHGRSAANNVNGRAHSALGGRANAPGHNKPAGGHRAIGKGDTERRLSRNAPAPHTRRERQVKSPAAPHAPRSGPGGNSGFAPKPHPVPAVPDQPQSTPDTPAEGTTGP